MASYCTYVSPVLVPEAHFCLRGVAVCCTRRVARSSRKASGRGVRSEAGAVGTCDSATSIGREHRAIRSRAHRTALVFAQHVPYGMHALIWSVCYFRGGVQRM